jgi:general secretion pathway protein A
MFLDFYGLREQPFGVTPDPRFLYLGQSHREALASLHYGIEADRGFVALIAPPGLGKTTLTFQLLEKLQQASRTVFLFQTKCNSKEFLHYLLNGLGVDAEGMALVSMHNKLNEILGSEMLAGRRLILAIDEAQNLDPEVLETIRLLSNCETSQSKLLQILLIGQPQLARKLASPELEQLQQRISVFSRLEPFGSEDIARYIAHRLQVAGYEGSSLFSPGALRIIANQSHGVPRKINGLCFSALSLGCAMGRKLVDVGMMEEVVADHDVESLHRPIVNPCITHLPVTTRPVLSYDCAKPKKYLGRWALSTAAVAASMSLGYAILSYSPDRIDRYLQASTKAWISVQNAAASSIGGFTKVKSLFPSTINEDTAEIPNTEPRQSSARVPMLRPTR